MNWTLESLFTFTEDRISDYRKIDRFIKTHEFIDYFDRHAEQTDLIVFLISSRRVNSLKRLIKGVTPLELMSYAQLRSEAQRLGIKWYSRMSKEELLGALLNDVHGWKIPNS